MNTLNEKSRVMVVNKFYYQRGGDCICTINTERLLREHGHPTAVYAMTYPDNIDTEWNDRFASQVDFSGGVAAKVKAVGRTLGMGDIKKSFKSMLESFHPDVMHLNNIHSYLSPILAKMAKEHGARVVWTLHDYKLLCPAYTCLRADGTICEECFTSKRGVMTHKCMKGSTAASAIAWLEALKWSRRKLERYVDTFICPSQFMADKMQQGGFSSGKIATLCNFVAMDKLEKLGSRIEPERDDYFCYIGRLSKEKGVEQMLEAAAALPYPLKVAGGGPLEEELRKKYRDCHHITFLGHLGPKEVSDLLARARFSILPSVWYENNPLGVIESRCAGTPVAGAEIGGIPELITPESGMVFRSGDIASLADTIELMWKKPWDHAAIQRTALDTFTPEDHYQKLIKIYAGAGE